MSLREQIAGAVARIAADHCGTNVVRLSELQACGAADDLQSSGHSGARVPAVESLWRELSAAGLDRAMAPESAGGAGLGWREVLPLVLAVGEFAMPVPLAETLAAHALATACGRTLPEARTRPGQRVLPKGDDRLGLDPGRDANASLAALPGAAGFGRLMRAGETLVADEVAWGDRIEILAGVDSRGAVYLLQAADAAREDRCNQAGEIRSRMVWKASPGAVGTVDSDAVVTLGAALRAAQLAAAMRRAMAMTVRYAGEREQFGRPIGRFQAVQQQMAVMAELVVQASIGAELAFDTAGSLPDPVRAGCAKQVASANALQCAAIAHAVHGAIGITEEYDLQLFTRRLRAWAAEWGGAGHWAMALGARLVGDGPVSVWHAVIDASGGERLETARGPTT